jgi:ketosteroid isomerase-like protein
MGRYSNRVLRQEIAALHRLTRRPTIIREMFDDDVDLIRRTLAEFNHGGVEAALGYFDEDVEWLAPPEWLEEPVYRGHDGIRRIASMWTENFDDYRLDPERFLDGGGQVVALVFQRGRIKPTGDWIEQAIGYVWRVQDGKTVRVQVHFSWDAALEEAGLR